jgi:hypothetical protein
LGEHVSAHDHLETTRSKIEIVGNPARAFSRGINMKVIECALAAHVDWHLGYPDRAVGISQESIRIARQLDHPLSLAMALVYAAMLHQFRREPSEVRDLANAAMAICTEHEFAYYRAWATVLLGWATAEHGDLEQGITGILAGVRTCATPEPDSGCHTISAFWPGSIIKLAGAVTLSARFPRRWTSSSATMSTGSTPISTS